MTIERFSVSMSAGNLRILTGVRQGDSECGMIERRLAAVHRHVNHYKLVLPIRKAQAIPAAPIIGQPTRLDSITGDGVRTGVFHPLHPFVVG